MKFLVKDILAFGSNRLSQAGIEEYKIDAELLYCYMAKCERSKLFMEWAKEVSDSDFEIYCQLLDTRATGKPLQYITGHQEFMGFDFKVNESVLIPRNDTEVLVTEALEIINANKKIKKVYDLCTGSGAIAVSVAKLADGVTVTASDISSEALAVAEGNAKANGAKVHFAQGDLFEAVKKRFGKPSFDVIISNPPYIKSDVIETLSTDVKDHEPRLALDGGESGLDFYRQIVEEAPQYLTKGGWLMLEIGYDQADAIVALAAMQRTESKKRKKGQPEQNAEEIEITTVAADDRRIYAFDSEGCTYEFVRIIKDLAGLDRVAIIKAR